MQETNALAVTVLAPSEMEEEDYMLDSELEEEEVEESPTEGYSLLASHIIKTFNENRDAKRDSGIEDEIFASLRDYNGNYNDDEIAKIAQEGGSSIYMNLTATKSRAAMSWIRDILLSANQDAFSIEATPIPDLPEDLSTKLEESFKAEFLSKVEANPQGAPSPKAAQETISSLNRDRRDIKDAILEELNLEAAEQMYQMETKIKDDLKEGGWERALSDFIEDFCIFPTAFMKGPVVTKRPKMTWDKGIPVVIDQYVFINNRVSPMDIYPSPSATSISCGNLIEHMRLSPSELYSLKDAPGYHTDKIVKLIEDDNNKASWINTGIEEDRAEEEKRGDSTAASKGVYHALHFWGQAKGEDLEEWGIEGVIPGEPNKYYEIEAIMVGSEIVKCQLNTDPLKRRPYYKASYQNIPGSFWGRSLPSLMRDIQRMCNACARALANNMGLAAGPQIELYIDRLADAGDIEDIKPLKIWQVTNDPTGASGRAINFFQVPSIANELLGVYDKFEQKADDATGIPRYSYGNEKVGGAAQTASGLSMLLESATKSIKDAIRHIDSGLIIPRVEYQFYWNLVKNAIDYTGDIVVVAHGSNTLTLKGAQQAKRQEFLQITANQSDQDLMGPEGRAELIRELAKDLNLRVNVVPSRLELRKKLEEAKAAAAEAAKNGQTKDQSSMMATKIQIEGQERMHAETQKTRQMEMEIRRQDNLERNQIEREKMAVLKESSNTRAMIDSQKMQVDSQTKRDIARTGAAVTLSKANT